MHKGDSRKHVFIRLARVECSPGFAPAAKVVGQYHEAACSKPGGRIAPLRFGAGVFVRADNGCRPSVAIEYPSKLNVILGCEMHRDAGYGWHRWCGSGRRLRGG